MAWAATTTEGLLVYSLDASSTLSAELLEENVTPDETLRLLKSGDLAQALEMALRLRQKDLLLQIVESVPADQSESVRVLLNRMFSVNFAMDG